MTNPRDVVIVEGIRTPFAKAGTKFNDIPAAELGRAALKELIEKTNLDVDQVDEVIIGNTGSPSDAVNISRVVALQAGIPIKTSAYTVHRNCASALESVTSGYEKIKSGTMDMIVAGGTESMSNMPLLFTKEFTKVFGQFMAAKTIPAKLAALSQMKMAYLKPRVAIMEGLTDPFVGVNMGQTAETIAKEFNVTREEQDKYALRSHQLATANKAKLHEEIVDFYMPPKYKEVINHDLGPREGQTMEALAKLRPFFDKKYGTITAGNSCPITDGAAMVLLMSREKAGELGYKPIARIAGYGYAGLDPARMGLGPVYATPLALKRAGISFKDIGLVELNEAFAAQVMACEKAMASDKYCKENLGLDKAIGQLDYNILNVNGGAIALGHPVGTTGTRLVP